MTNLDYLKEEVDILKLAIYEGADLNGLIEEEGIDAARDYASHITSKERLFKGSVEDIAKNFLNYVEEGDCCLYINPFVGGDNASDAYYDRSFASPRDEILAHIIEFLNADYDEISFK